MAKKKSPFPARGLTLPLVSFVLGTAIYIAPSFLRADILAGWSNARLREFFDTNHDSIVSTRELRRGLVTVLQKIASRDGSFDFDGSGTVDKHDVGASVAVIRSVLSAQCGNGQTEAWEDCDDGNTGNGDGCTMYCTLESGFFCMGQPSVCESTVCTASAETLWSEKTLSPPQTQNINSFAAALHDRRGDLRRLTITADGHFYLFNRLEHMLHVRPDGSTELKSVPLNDADEAIRDAAYGEIFLPADVQVPHDQGSPTTGRFKTAVLSRHLPAFSRIVDLSVLARQSGTTTLTESFHVVPFTPMPDDRLRFVRGTETAVDLGGSLPNISLRMDIDEDTGDVYVVLLRERISSVSYPAIAYKFIWNGSSYEKSGELEIGLFDPVSASAIVRYYAGRLYVVGALVQPNGTVSGGIVELVSDNQSFRLGRTLTPAPVFSPRSLTPIGLSHALLLITGLTNHSFLRLDTQQFSLNALANPLDAGETVIGADDDHLIHGFSVGRNLIFGTVQETELPDGTMAVVEPLRLRKIQLSSACAQ